MEYDVKMVIVIRRDLNMRKGKMCAQAGHASLMFIRNILATKQPLHPSQESLAAKWLFGGQAKIVVGCDDETQLNELVAQAEANDVRVFTVTDAGNTEFHGEPTVTCAAFGPDRTDRIDSITGKLKLL